MSIYNWIQRKLLGTYVEWWIKNPNSNHKEFHIDGINNTLKAMKDGYIYYTEIRPPYAIKGCTSMKAVVAKNKDYANLYLEINGKKYCIYDLGYEDAIKIMRTFMQKETLPDEKSYVEVVDDENEKMQRAFVELSELLLGNTKHKKQFLKKVKPENEEDMEDAWLELYEELLRKGIAIELDWKVRKDDFMSAIKKLSKGTELEIDGEILDSDEDVPRWGKIINSIWKDYVLSAMDVGSDSYVLMILSKEDFIKAKELAREILNRIAVVEEM